MPLNIEYRTRNYEQGGANRVEDQFYYQLRMLWWQWGHLRSLFNIPCSLFGVLYPCAVFFICFFMVL